MSGEEVKREGGGKGLERGSELEGEGNLQWRHGGMVA